jgi:hypothetical protein
MRAQFRGNGSGGGPFAPWSEQSERLREADAQFNSITGDRDLLKRNMTIWIASVYCALVVANAVKVASS